MQSRTTPATADPNSRVKESQTSKAPLSKSIHQEPETMEELLSSTGYKMKNWQRGTVIEAKVLDVSAKHILLDIGGKSEAIVHEKELPYIGDLLETLKVGDSVPVQVVNPENERGQTVVSLRKSAVVKRWDTLNEKLKKDQSVDVIIKEMSRGGFLVDFMGLRGFIPMSQVDSELSRQGDRVVGRKLQVKILEVDREANRLVFSQLAGGLSDAQKRALSKVEVGKTYSGEVKGIAPFGAFVNVSITEGAVLPGLIHISEIAWEKVENPNDYLKIGQTVEVKIIGVDQKVGKLTLSLKQLVADPWEDVMKVFSIDQTVRGKVTRLTQYGAFVSLLPGIEGLVHISKIPPGTEPKVGEEVECIIEEITPDKRKVSLSLVTHAKPIGYR